MNLQSIIDRLVKNPSYLDKGAGFLAKVFKTSKENIYKAKEKARATLNASKETELQNIIAEHEETINKKFNSKGECDIEGKTTKRIKTLEDLINVCEIDTEIWEIVSWECNKWEVGAKDASHKIQVTPLFQVKAKLKPISNEVNFQKEFTRFLSTYTPSVPKYTPAKYSHHRDCGLLVLPKQDAHFNRYDVKGRNDIQARFRLVESTTHEIVEEAHTLNELEKITYIVGSDQFNSEWNGMTTMGTPQENILTYQQAFKLICDHEVAVIEDLLNYTKNLEILFVPGNHDEYAGWHMINWLACYYRKHPYVTVTEGNPDDPRRYERYGNTAVMYDHGASMTGKELAQRFPLEFRKEWSKCDTFYIFSGDKHNELSFDVQGIKFYRVPALTPTKSKWEHRKGYLTPGEMQAFLIKKNKGLTNIYSRLLE